MIADANSANDSRIASAKQPDASLGFIPATGFITGDRLAAELRLKHPRALQDALAKSDIEYVTLVGKRLYRCDDLNALFLGGRNEKAAAGTWQSRNLPWFVRTRFVLI
ncbi:hypothetical protein [Mariniblastus fucicola]|uniref:Uncharacterized protein n=1 Tax=Mariniblastus fucicola TaxID=980251 RepID=A0A5B9PMS7_9BACT|nr:hypothetical protein [Mariniblastus fucicola]QEG23891.1 hypothetical protein MFFC18_37950 [Mariniblastus fucicola]